MCDSKTKNTDERWMGLTHHVSTWSKDRSRKIGAVIVNEHEVPIIGWNGFPRGINDDVECRHQRPDKYDWTVHAEQNAICNAAASGYPTRNTRIYQSMFPCSVCSGLIIQAGIREVITHKPDFDDETYARDFKLSLEKLNEAGVKIRFVDGESPQRASDEALGQKSDESGVSVAYSRLLLNPTMLSEWLASYFGADDPDGTYAYWLTRLKSAYDVETVTTDDFVEFNSITYDELAGYIIGRIKDIK